MATNAVALAWRSAGRRAPALHSLRATQRPSILHRETLLRQVRYSSDAASQTKEAAKETTAQVTETVKEAPKKTGRKLKRTVWGTSLALTLLAGYVYGTDTRASVHRYGVVPLVRLLFPDAEDAHHFGVDILKTLYKYGLNPRERGDPDSDGALLTEVYTSSPPLPNLTPILTHHLRSSATPSPTRSASPAASTSTPTSPTLYSNSAPPSSKSAAPLPSPKKAIPAHESSASRPRTP